MAAYTFETIGVAEAMAFSAATDTLSFTTPGSSAGNIQVTFQPNHSNVAITSSITGRTVLFFNGSVGGTSPITFPDGTTAYVGRSFQSFYGQSAGNGRDALYGDPGADELRGGGGDDTLVGGGGADELDGGAGNDLFIIYPGDAPLRDDDSRQVRDTIADWRAGDLMSFGALKVSAANYAEITADGPYAAELAADALIAQGVVDVVVVKAGLYLLVFADSRQDNGRADESVMLVQTATREMTLDDIDAGQFVTTTPRAAFMAPAPDPKMPAAPTPPAGTTGNIAGNMDAVHISGLIGSQINAATSTVLGLQGVQVYLSLNGTNFTYDANSQLIGGSITNLRYDVVSAPTFSAALALSGVSAASFGKWLAADANQQAFSTLLAGNNHLQGSTQSDLIRAYGGDDVILSGGGSDSLFGGDGDDQITGSWQDPSYLRGEAGADYIVGGSGFDDINGNMGNDTAGGGAGTDWVVGGQGQDLLFGETGNDIVYGNMGNDSCYGGDGADLVRGGQGDDIVYGGSGNDWLSGDRGSDTVTGGAGADAFHSFSDAGLDRVTDFNAAEGDRVQLDLGSRYTLSQVGADTVVDMGGGNQAILVGITLANLPTGWIFEL